MTDKEIPAAAVLLGAAVVFEVLGGLALLVGFKGRIAALALFLYLVPVTLLFHHFWDLVGGDRQVQAVNFFKNVAIMGGLAMVMAFGSGPMSLDARREG